MIGVQQRGAAERNLTMESYPELKLLIDNKWESRTDGEPVFNPADETVIGTVPPATIADLDVVVSAAERGFQVWKRTAPAQRAQIMLRATGLIQQRIESITLAMTLEQGKPLAQSRLEVLRACKTG